MTWEQWSRLSQWVWEFMRDAPFSPREETITESLIVKMAREDLASVVVVKSTTGDESERGHDWAWAIETSAGWINLMVQAKKLSPDPRGRFEDLEDKKTGKDQVERLIRAAADMGALPVYALYNGEAGPYAPSGHPVVVEYGACEKPGLLRTFHSGLPPWITCGSPQGVTLAHADDILKHVAGRGASAVYPDKVNTFAMPWECFFCPHTSGSYFSGPLPGRIITKERRSRIADASAAFMQSGEEGADVPWVSRFEPRWAAQLRELPFLRPEDRLEFLRDFWREQEIPDSVGAVVAISLAPRLRL